MTARETISRATYPRPRAAERSKQWAGMASRICLIVKSGIWNSFPYVSSNLPLACSRSNRLSESRDERDVDDADCRGESSGEAEREFEDDAQTGLGFAGCSSTFFRERLEVAIFSRIPKGLRPEQLNEYPCEA